MKVVQINSVAGQGSTGKLVASISDKMDEKGIENHILYGVGETDRKNAYKFENNLSLRFNILKTRLFGKHAFYSHRATRKLIRKLEQLKPDVVHIHQIHGHYLNIKMLSRYLKAKSIPVVINLHDCWLYTGHCTHYTSAKCYKWKDGCGGCPQLSAYPKTLFFDRSRSNWKAKRDVFLGFDKVVYACVSGWLEKETRQSFLGSKPITTVYNGVDCQVFKPGEKQDGDFTILCMYGKWMDRINAPYREHLTSKLQAHPEIRLILLGAPENAQEGNIQRIKYQSNPAELASVYSRADVFLNLSHEDSFSLVSAEALACGTPVVCFRSTAIPEVVGTDGSCGYTVAEGSAEQLWDCIERIKREGKRSYTEACRARAVKQFDLNQMTERYIQLYYEVCKEQ